MNKVMTLLLMPFLLFLGINVWAQENEKQSDYVKFHQGSVVCDFKLTLPDGSYFEYHDTRYGHDPNNSDYPLDQIHKEQFVGNGFYYPSGNRLALSTDALATISGVNPEDSSEGIFPPSMGETLYRKIKTLSSAPDPYDPSILGVHYFKNPYLVCTLESRGNEIKLSNGRSQIWLSCPVSYPHMYWVSNNVNMLAFAEKGYVVGFKGHLSINESFPEGEDTFSLRGEERRAKAIYAPAPEIDEGIIQYVDGRSFKGIFRFDFGGKSPLNDYAEILKRLEEGENGYAGLSTVLTISGATPIHGQEYDAQKNLVAVYKRVWSEGGKWVAPKSGRAYDIATIKIKDGRVTEVTGIDDELERARATSEIESVLAAAKEREESIRRNREQEELAKQKQAKVEAEEYENLCNKYGKQYVDAYYYNNTIIVGTPEAMITALLNSKHHYESQYTRSYYIYNFIGDPILDVDVDVKTKKVIRVNDYRD